MNKKCNSYWCYLVVAIVFLVGGYFLGKYCQTCSASEGKNLGSSLSASELEQKSMDELFGELSGVMLPKEEYDKLMGAIEQTGMGLLKAQAQGQHVEITPEMERELQNRIKEKYSRNYFTKINAKSMNVLQKDELVRILAFYSSAPGQKIRELTPQIINDTMAEVQKDLSDWLPENVSSLISSKDDSGSVAPASETK